MKTMQRPVIASADSRGQRSNENVTEFTFSGYLPKAGLNLDRGWTMFSVTSTLRHAPLKEHDALTNY